MMDDDDSFAEEERVLDFGEEEDTVPYGNSQPHLFRDYGGEDFSKYLKDDDDDEDDMVPCSVVGNDVVVHGYDYDDGDGAYDSICPDAFTGERKGSSGLGMDMENSSDLSYSARSQGSGTSPEQTVKDGKSKSLGALKDKLGKYFTNKKSRKPNGVTAADSNPNKIYNFSYADSKIGNSLALLEQQQMRGGGTGNENCDSGIGMDPSLEVQSDVGGNRRSSWWSIGTLSSRSKVGAEIAAACANPDYETKTKNRRSKSIPFLTESTSDLQSPAHCIDKQAGQGQQEPDKNNIKRNKVGNALKRMSDTLRRKSGSFDKESVNNISTLSYTDNIIRV